MLLQISEPNGPNENSRARKLGLGIDLGTTNSLVAIKMTDVAHVLTDKEGQALLPSVVNFCDEV